MLVLEPSFAAHGKPAQLDLDMFAVSMMSRGGFSQTQTTR